MYIHHHIVLYIIMINIRIFFSGRFYYYVIMHSCCLVRLHERHTDFIRILLQFNILNKFILTRCDGTNDMQNKLLPV